MSHFNAIINDFQHGNIALLIATTVVEVGVNIPMATVIIVEDAIFLYCLARTLLMPE
ncbi:helicase-related protein [Candidatus Deianiraea vastatrix]|uniref:helicase-related protein n=1 Tax=Candidatus Deianiraea vastatrix TaxID=2163644 RepID=UPI001CA3E007|nr:helicase-related protein [Candidatus Deianiraea vastatrix]